MEEIGATHDQGAMHDHSQPTGTVQLPAPTSWPIVFALGISLMLAGMVTHWAISLLGLLMAVPAIVEWFSEFLAQFHPEGLLAALAIHGLTSVLIGLLYGAMLPMYPKKPILTFGFVAPFLWTGILRSALGIISPILDQRIDWWWFIVSQIAFGLVAGFVVNLHVKVRTPQFRALPFTVRAGIHILEENKEEDKDKAP